MKNIGILVSNLNIDLAEYIKKTLNKEGYNTLAESNFERQKDIISKNDFSLIITDENIYDTLLETKSNTPKLVLTKNSKIDDSENKYYYLVSPFPFQDLIDITKRIISENNINKNEIHIDNLIIDIKNKIVVRDGKNITLTKKEYILLTYLAKNEDKAVSRSDLLENVWGMQIDPFSNTVEAHIFSLRKKIDGNQTVKLIHTIPKFGYRVSKNK